METGTTSPEAQVPQVPEYDSFEYTSYGSSDTRISITKYTGNAANVVVPAQIDGKIVVEIQTGAFSNNSKITKIVFESDSAQPFYGSTMAV